VHSKEKALNEKKCEGTKVNEQKGIKNNNVDVWGLIFFFDLKRCHYSLVLV